MVDIYIALTPSAILQKIPLKVVQSDNFARSLLFMKNGEWWWVVLYIDTGIRTFFSNLVSCWFSKKKSEKITCAAATCIQKHQRIVQCTVQNYGLG